MDTTYTAGVWRVALASDKAWGVYRGDSAVPICTFLSWIAA